MSHGTASDSRTRGDALQIAARSILESRAFDGTVQQVISGRALDHHWRALFQYAALQVGPEMAKTLLLELAAESDEAAAGDTEPREHPAREFYGRLRTLCREASQRKAGEAGREPLSANAHCFWRAPDATYAQALSTVRRKLTREQAEVAELHCARGLSLPDVAEVIGEREGLVSERLEQALRFVSAMYPGRHFPSQDNTAEGVLLEAFSLDPLLAPPPPRRQRAPIVTAGDIVAGRYEIESLLGSGAFADVYRARDRDVEGHTVALKMSRTASVDEQSVQIALRELQLLASVFHPSVVQLKDHGWHNGHLWFVMPLYRGETLAARLRRGALTRREARAIFEPLAEALATMHRAGVLHQDIKPDNIFLANIDPSDEEPSADVPGQRRQVLPILLDLGVAAKDAELVLAGTPAYLAPEVAARFAAWPDPAPIGPKADVFALALTLRDALKGGGPNEPPLTSVDAFLSKRATTAPPPPASKELKDLRGVFARWLHLRPDRRPTADELRHELSALTAPEERRARRNATLRWAVPTALSLFSFFALVVYGLSQEAASQRIEAHNARVVAAEARERAASIKTDLQAQEARSKELEANIARLESDYRQSRLTRDQLASRLAVAEGELRVVRERADEKQQEVDVLKQDLASGQQERAGLRQQLRQRRDEIGVLDRQLDRQRANLSEEQQENKEQARLREQLKERMAELEAALEQSRKELSSVQAQRRAPAKGPGNSPVAATVLAR